MKYPVLKYPATGIALYELKHTDEFIKPGKPVVVNDDETQFKPSLMEQKQLLISNIKRIYQISNAYIQYTTSITTV